MAPVDAPVAEKSPICKLDGSFTISEINYYCDLGNSEGLVIPLGVIAEIVVDKTRGLGIIARKDLTLEELDNVGELSRELLENLFNFLGECFDDAWDNAEPGRCLEYLALKNCYSLRFEIPKCDDISLTIPSAKMIRRSVRDFLVNSLEDSILKLFPYGDVDEPLPQNELLELAAA